VSVPETIEEAGGETVWVDRPGGVRLRAALFGPPGAAGWCAVCPGYTEFIEKYLEVVGELRDRGFGVVVHDWRGQGLSSRLVADRHKGHVESFDLPVADLRAVWAATGLGERVGTVLAHSMGGHIALRAMAAEPGLVDRAVLTAPMMGVIGAGMPETLARAVLTAAGALGLSRRYVIGGAGYDVARKPFEGNRLTRDPERFARMHRLIAANPDLAVGDPTMGWVREAFRSIALTRRPGWLEAIETPILIAIAGDDRIVNNAAIEETVRRLPHAEAIRFEGARHEILGELEGVRTAFWGAFDRFVAAR